MSTANSRLALRPSVLFPTSSSEQSPLVWIADPCICLPMGLTECRDGAGRELGVNGLCEIIGAFEAHPSSERLERVVKKLRETEMQINDDVTMLVIDS